MIRLDNPFPKGEYGIFIQFSKNLSIQIVDLSGAIDTLICFS